MICVPLLVLLRAVLEPSCNPAQLKEFRRSLRLGSSVHVSGIPRVSQGRLGKPHGVILAQVKAILLMAGVDWAEIDPATHSKRSMAVNGIWNAPSTPNLHRPLGSDPWGFRSGIDAAYCSVDVACSRARLMLMMNHAPEIGH
jgi:hypothetical protein